MSIQQLQDEALLLKKRLKKFQEMFADELMSLNDFKVYIPTVESTLHGGLEQTFRLFRVHPQLLVFSTFSIAEMRV